jgi:hypothetical protein
MSEKELLQQLKSLKSIKLDAEEKESNKKVLMTQISNTLTQNKEAKTFNSFSFYFKNVLSMTSKPAMILGGLFLFLFTSVLLSSSLYKDSKPTDSLYIARVISEKAKLNTTFDKEAKERMVVEFASSHASDIASILMDPEINNEENQEQVERLTNSFKTEISKVRDVRSGEENDEVNNEVKDEVEEDSSVFSASTLKEDNGVEISMQEQDSDVSTTSEEEEEKEEEISSSSISELESQIEGLEKDYNNIDEIERLFEEGKYSEVILMLEDIK